jgi:serine/threonine protein kinase
MGTEGDNVRVIAGRYRLEVRLGRGGMGVVWRATDQLLGRQVAVKELPLDETLSAAEARRQRDRTLREARAVAQLSHPHIVVVHDVVEDDERPYIVMELINGSSLADRIATRGPVDAGEAARIGIALLGALGAAHAAGVLHPDLKTSASPRSRAPPRSPRAGPSSARPSTPRPNASPGPAPDRSPTCGRWARCCARP